MRFRPGASAAERAAAHAAAGCGCVRACRALRGMEVVEVAPGRDPDEALRAYRAHAAVAYAEPDQPAEI